MKPVHDATCAVACSAEIIGSKWTALLVHDLSEGPRRFSELRADLTGISANVLTQRLMELEDRGLVRKTKLPPPASVQVYEATEWGLEATPIIASLGKWAARSPLHDPTLRMSHVSVIMSFQTLISPERAKGFKGRVCFRFGEASYVTTVADGRLEVERRHADDCDVTFTGTPTEIAAVIHGGAPFETIRVEGDMAFANRFRTLFPLPEKVVRS